MGNLIVPELIKDFTVYGVPQVQYTVGDDSNQDYTSAVTCASFKEAAAIEAVCTRLPAHLHAAVEQLTLHWDAERPEVPGMFELVRELSEAGYELCLLTNASLRHHEYWPTFRFAPYFGDRIMLSAEWRILKPDPAFYEKAVALLGYTPEKVMIVTSDYHVARAVQIAKDQGLDAYGMSAPTLPEYWLKNRAREALGWGKYLLNRALGR